MRYFTYAATLALLALALAACCPQAPRKDIHPELFRGILEYGDSAERMAYCKKYLEGDGLPQDVVKAYLLARQAATACDPDAALTLSRMYAEGLGVAREDETALGWNYLVEMGKHPGVSMGLRETLEGRLSEEEKARARDFAAEWRRTRCEADGY